MRLRQPIKVLSINLLLILVAGLLVELIFGSWFNPRSLAFYDIEVSMRYKFNTEDLYPGGGLVIYETDKYGLRGEYGRPDDIDILAIGGSTTDERYVTEGETWIDVLSSKLSSDGATVRVANAGIPAQSTYGNIKMFDVWFPKVPGLTPKFVLALIGINDVALAAPRYYDKLEPKNLYHRWRLALYNDSALYDLYRRLRGIYRAYVTKVVYFSGDGVFGSGTYPWVPWAVTTKPAEHGVLAAELAPLLDAYAHRIRVLHTRIRAMGARAIFVSQTRGDYRIDGDRMYYKNFNEHSAEAVTEIYIKQTLYNEQLMKTCEQVNAICVALHRELQFVDGDFMDYVHTTPTGSRKIGEYIADKIAPYLTSRRSTRGLAISPLSSTPTGR